MRAIDVGGVKTTPTEERFGAVELSDAAAWNQAEVAGEGPVTITTSPERWAFAALFPIHDDPESPLSDAGPLLVRIQVTVEQGELGFAIAEPGLNEFITDEKRAKPMETAEGSVTLELTLNVPAPGCWLVARNCAEDATATRARIHNIRTFLKPATDAEVWLDVGAHLGEKTFRAAADNPNLRVYAFEPNLKTASTLMGRLSNYVVLPLAISEEDGSAPFYLNRMDAASSLLPFVPEGLAKWAGGELLHIEETRSVPTIRLDTFLNQTGIKKVNYLKIDAQGGDLAVVRSLGERLKDVFRIDLEVQITAVPLYAGASGKREVIEFLTGAGFALISAEQQSLGQEENLTFVRRKS